MEPDDRRPVLCGEMAGDRIVNHFPDFFKCIRLRKDGMTQGAGFASPFGGFFNNEDYFPGILFFMVIPLEVFCPRFINFSVRRKCVTGSAIIPIMNPEELPKVHRCLPWGNTVVAGGWHRMPLR
jgi:hypothetical protein